MKIKEYSDMHNYLVRKDTRTTEQIKAAEAKKKKAELTRINNKRKEYALPTVTEFSDTPMGKHIENTLYMYGDLDKKPKHYDSELNKAQQTINKVIDYSPKKTKRPEAIIKTPKPKQLEFNFQELFKDLDSITKTYEPVPTPPAVAPRDKDLDKGIASILNVRVRNA